MRLLLGALLLLVSAAAADEGDLERLLQQADADHWQKRWPAVRALSRLAQAGDDTSVFRLRGLMLRDPRPRVREALAWACRLEPALGQATLLGIVLKKDPQPAVRRAAAGALRHYRDRRAIAALIEALAGETDPRTRLHIAETLRALTPAPCLLEADPWRAWWANHKDDAHFRPADEEPQRGEYEGIVLETRTVAPVPRKGPRRPPPHVLVLPQFGWSTAAFGPYLLPLREHAAITWVRLPTVQTLTGSSGYGGDIPTYPVGRLVRALERFRAAHRVDRFVVLAHGASGWIAMRYAITYPRRCSALILVDTALDKEAYSRILHYAAARGSEAERFVAKTLTHQNSVPFSPATLQRIHALGLARGFHDPADLEIAWIYGHAREPQGFATVPEIAWRRHRTVAIPSLFLYSAASAFSGHRDADRIQRHFTRSLVAPVREARGVPFVEENPKFHEVIRAFLTRFGLIDRP